VRVKYPLAHDGKSVEEIKVYTMRKTVLKTLII